MSRKAYITIDGLLDWDPDLFEDLSLPTQFAEDPEIITDQLVLETMSLEVLYPNPAIFKKALKIFSRSRLQRWQKITDALYHVYDPFINFTRDETRTITETRDLEANRTDNLQSQRTDALQAQRTDALQMQRTDQLSEQRTDNLTSLETRNLAGSATNTKQVAAWDNQTSSLTDREKDTAATTDTGTDQIANTGTQTTSNTGTQTTANTGTQTTANTGTQKTTDEGTVVTEDVFHSEGDSALFTPTDVAKKEFELRAMDDAISYIVHDIRDHFCLTVY